MMDNVLGIVRSLHLYKTKASRLASDLSNNTNFFNVSILFKFSDNILKQEKLVTVDLLLKTLLL